MDSKTFRRIVEQELRSVGFEGSRNTFRKNVPGLAIVVGIQKSAYSNAFYLNVGYILKELAGDQINVSYVDGHVRARFSFGREVEKGSDLFELDTLDEARLTRVLEENRAELIAPISSVDDLRTLIHRKPILRYQTTVGARHLLGIE